jgi:hypothetical protein
MVSRERGRENSTTSHTYQCGSLLGSSSFSWSACCVCKGLCACINASIPCLCPGGKKVDCKSRGSPFPNARRPGTRSHVAHLIAVPPGRALVNFSARAEQRHARYGRSAVALFHRLLVASRPGGAHFLVTVRSAGRTQMFWAVARPARPRSTADSQ